MIMSYINFMEPEAVTEVGNIPGTAVQTRAILLRIALLASNKTRKFHRKIFHTCLNLYYTSKGAVIDTASSKHALKQAFNFVNFLSRR